VLSKKPNSAFSKFSRIGRGEFLVRHRAHPLSVLLSGKPGAVQIASLRLHWWPVGQGLYSSGLIQTLSGGVFSWVYDCGTSSSPLLIDDALSKDQAERVSVGVEKIDLVVLSHFDKDHIIGFLRLIAASPIKRILIPYVPLWKRLILAIEQDLSAEDPTFQFFLNPVAYLRGIEGADIEEIIFVPASEPGDGASAPDDPEPPILPEGEEIEWTWPPVGELHAETGVVPTEAVGDPAVEEDEQGKKPVFLKPGGRIVASGFWEFVPYNDAERKYQADAKFISSAEPLLELVKNDLTKRNKAFGDLKSLYIKTFGPSPKDKNIISLFLYSGPISTRLQLDTVLTSHLVECPAITTRYAQIHTGDGTLKGDHYTRFESFFKGATRLQKLGIFQVMHHGAKPQWHAGIAAKLNPTASIFSSDPAHRSYKHPHAEVLRDFWPYHPIQVDKVTGFHLFGYLILT
jgi:glyoxylase-like metal-dependent hydrolase (beta-lactamase superfamily II)